MRGTLSAAAVNAHGKSRLPSIDGLTTRSSLNVVNPTFWVCYSRSARFQRNIPPDLTSTGRRFYSFKSKMEELSRERGGVVG
jgi:hypothetical protein